MNRRQFLQQTSAAAGLAVPAHAQTPRPEIRLVPVDFGAEKQVFADWQFIEAGYGLAFTVNEQKQNQSRPVFMPRGVSLRVFPPMVPERPGLVPETPADGILTGGYSTLLRDGGKFRLYYESYQSVTSDEEAKICCAESEDGITWRKPDLGIIEFRGNRRNNIVYEAGHGGTVFIDPGAPAAERYKLVHVNRVPLQEYQGRQINSAVFGAISPDGLHWSRLPEPVMRHTSDTQSVAVRDVHTGRYVCYVRGWEPRTRAGYGGRRVVMRSESADFRSFPEPETVLAMGPEDPPDADIYTNAYQPWPGAANAHIMMPAVYHRAIDQVDVHFAISRDGRRWHRPLRDAWIPAGEPGSGLEGTLYAGVGLTPAGGGNWMFPLARYELTHNANRPEYFKGRRRGGLWLARIREDGVMGLCAETQGECWTQPATFAESRLLLNCWATRGGRVDVEIAGVDGKPFPGFSLADCDGLEGDHLWSPMRWRGNENTGSLAGKPVRLRFSLTRTRLYAFRFAA
jgi:hypothetical protein